jgi:hypothetical protein
MPGEVQPEADTAIFAAHRPSKPTVPYTSPPDEPFRMISAQMTLRLHVSPDRGWPELQAFLNVASTRLVVGMYQCTAPHIQSVLEQGLGQAGKLTVTMDSPPDSKKREQTVEETESNLENDLGVRLAFAWALSGLGKEAPAKAFPTAYHIKVAVRDSDAVWLSSGNWNTSNQPPVDPDVEGSLEKAAE